MTDVRSITRLTGTMVTIHADGATTVHSRGAVGVRRAIDAALREALLADAHASDCAAAALAARPHRAARPLACDRLDEVAAVLERRDAIRRADAALARAARLEAALYDAARSTNCVLGFTKENK